MLNGDYVKAGASGGFAVSADCSLLRHSSIQRRIALIEKDPEQHPWMYRGIVRKDDNWMVGHISFHHKAPDPDLFRYSKNAAELGYAIEVGQRRNGYAKESAFGMMDWAIRRGVGTFILSICPRNMPSIRMAESMGFTKISERIDEIDGLEYVYIVEL
jgi:RimJ/RimL family protein N-acetyltransferase